MHTEALKFINYIKTILSNYFKNKNVLDVGSGDINGNNKMFFENCNYIGNDVFEGPNVNIVSKTKDLPYDDNIFDTIISTECFEHDYEYKESLLKIYKMLKPDGLFVFTCASKGRPEHGTINNEPNSSYASMNEIENFKNYYYNLEIKDIDNVLNLNKNFIFWYSYYNTIAKDLYFIGIKNNIDNNNIYNNNINIYNLLPKYNDKGVIHTKNDIN